MPRLVLVLLALIALAPPSSAQDEYGSRGLFPVYKAGNQWVIFDKPRKSGKVKDLLPGSKFLIVGSIGADLFVVGRTSPTYGGACRNKKPLKLRAALLKGPRSTVGDPVMAIKVPDDFQLKGSRARYDALANKVDEPLYQLLGSTLTARPSRRGRRRLPVPRGRRGRRRVSRHREIGQDRDEDRLRGTPTVAGSRPRPP